VSRSLVAEFVRTWEIAASANPEMGGRIDGACRIIVGCAVPVAKRIQL
jgi:hypothetical protein